MLEYDKNGLVVLDRLETVKEHADLLPHDLAKLVILITGSGPGTGASTLEKILARTLNVESVSAGGVRRTIALNYVQYCHQLFREKYGVDIEFTEENEPQLTAFFTEIWEAFPEMYFTHRGMPKKTKKIKEHLSGIKGNVNSQDNLLAFMRHQREFGLENPKQKTRELARRFDTIPDILAYSVLTAKPEKGKLGKILEGKLALLIQEIALQNMHPKDRDKTPELARDKKTAVIPLFLEVSEYESARRVLLREVINETAVLPSGVMKEHILDFITKKELPTNKILRGKIRDWFQEKMRDILIENIERMEQDYDRWSALYGTPINSQILQERAIATIDTTNKTRAEVVLAAYTAISSVVPSLASVLFEGLSTQFTSEKELS